MPEEMESPVESVAEHMHHEAEHSQEKWLKWAALMAAVYAVLAAVAGLQSSHFANDAMIEHIEASDQWGYYQAKGIKRMIAENERETLKALGKEVTAAPDPAKYKHEQDEIEAKAQEKVEEAKGHLEQHEVISRAVTMLQVSIAIIAIAVLTRRRHFAVVSLVMAAIGVVFMAEGLLLPFFTAGVLPK